VDDSLVALVIGRGYELRADGAGAIIHLEINGESDGVFFSADVTILVVAQLGHGYVLTEKQDFQDGGQVSV
jgi:hypothetical protein